VRLGVHVSIKESIDKAVDRASALGCNTFQIFTRNPRQWKARVLTSEEIQGFVEKVKSRDFRPVVSHMPYLPNLASPKETVYVRSVETLKMELQRCGRLEIPFLVTHLGSHLGVGKEMGYRRIINAIDRTFQEVDEDVILLLENAAGTRNSMGSYFEDLQYIIDGLLFPKRVGVCFDTCHAYAAGYDLRTQKTIREVLRRVDETVGFERLRLVHLNDSTSDLKAGRDRHEHIGMGKIGEEGFKHVLRSRLGRLPLILETPFDERRGDDDNLSKVREISGDLYR
jgi:deoxyribonuclease-4